MSMCATCGEFINGDVCKCPRGLESMAGLARRAQSGGEVGAVCSTPECDEQAVVCAACAQGRYAEGLHDGQARVRELEAELAAKEEEVERYKSALYSISDATWAQDRDPQVTARELRSKIKELVGSVIDLRNERDRLVEECESLRGLLKQVRAIDARLPADLHDEIRRALRPAGEPTPCDGCAGIGAHLGHASDPAPDCAVCDGTGKRPAGEKGEAE